MRYPHMRGIIGWAVLAVGYAGWGRAEESVLPTPALPAVPPVAAPSLVQKVEIKSKPPKEPVLVIPSQVPYELIPLPQGLIELFGGAEHFKAVLAAQRIEIVKLKPGSLLGPNAPEYTEDGMAVVTGEDAAALQARVTLDGSYEWSDFPECLPVYGFRFKFRSKERVVVIDLCFECAMLLVHDPRPSPADGSFRLPAEASFKPVYEAYVELINRYFKDALPRSKKF